MSILDSIVTTTPGAPRITVYGKPGIGKSTLASNFPKPLFILTEDSELVGIKRLPIAKSFTDVWGMVKGLLEIEKLEYKTIVIDSISKLDALVVEHVLSKEPVGKNGMQPTTLAAACGGFGAGFQRAASIHRAFKAQMDKFKERGITVIYVSHLAVTKHKSPDADDYDIHNIVMNHASSRECYIDDVDLVGFCKLKSYTSETESGRIIVKSTEERVIVTGISDAHVSKNRFAMPNEMPMKFEEIAKYIPYYNLETEL